MKRVLLFSFVLMLPVGLYAQSLHYLVKRVETCIDSKWEQDASGNTCLNYYNTDHCDYLRFQDNESKVLRPGKTTVYTRKKSELESAYKYGKNYYLYRGRFPKKDFNPFFVYALPLKDGKNLKWKLDTKEPKRTLMFKTEYQDTVYACRRGIACVSGDTKKGILIYHQDFSFAAYMNLSESFIVPGEEVMTGQPIGLASHESVSLSVFFLDKNLFGEKYTVHPYTHIMPVFRTDKGDVRLEKGIDYKVVTDDDLIMSEMSKAEKKRFMKRSRK